LRNRNTYKKHELTESSLIECCTEVTGVVGEKGGGGIQCPLSPKHTGKAERGLTLCFHLMLNMFL